MCVWLGKPLVYLGHHLEQDSSILLFVGFIPAHDVEISSVRRAFGGCLGVKRR